MNVGELVDLARSVAPADELCGCGERFSVCPVWTQVGEVAFKGWTPDVLDRLTALQRAAARQRHLPGMLGSRRRPSTALVDLRTAYTRIYRAVAEVTGSRVVVDASKGPALGLALAGAPGIDLRMLNVVRDPRAVAWSWQRHVERPHADRPSGEEMWRIPAHRSAAQWSALQLEMSAIAGLGGVPHVAAALRGLRGRPGAQPRRRRPRSSASRSPRRTCRPSRTAAWCSAPATGSPATRAGSAPAPSSCAATTAGRPRCPPPTRPSSPR